MKKNAIRFLIVAFAFAALSLPALAQGGPAGAAGEGQGPHHGMPSVDERVQHLTKMLNLSGDQQTKIKSILQDEHNQMTSLKQDKSLSQEDQHAKFQQIHQASAAENPRGAKRRAEGQVRPDAGRAQGAHGQARWPW